MRNVIQEQERTLRHHLRAPITEVEQMTGDKRMPNLITKMSTQLECSIPVHSLWDNLQCSKMSLEHCINYVLLNGNKSNWLTQQPRE